MKTLRIEIPNGHEIDIEKSDISKGVVVFKEVTKKYPISVKDIDRPFFIDAFGDILRGGGIGYQGVNQVSTKERAEALIALIQLVELRDAWNKIDDFEADWTDRNESKYCIINRAGKVEIEEMLTWVTPLSFGSAETSELFFEAFRDLIEKAKEFL